MSSKNSFARQIPATPEEFINQARESGPLLAPPVVTQLEAIEEPVEAPAAEPVISPAPAPRAPRRSTPAAPQLAAPANPWDALDDAEVPLFQPVPEGMPTDDEKQFSAYMSSAEHFMVSDTLRHLPNTSLRRYAREALLMRIKFDRERLLKLHGKKA